MKSNNVNQPFLKWAGGKRWLIKDYSEYIPKNFNRYIEPFLGGGAVFFHLKPSKAILNDSNTELILTYKEIRDNWSSILKLLRNHHNNHSEKYYYHIRSKQFVSKEERVAQFIYLNRTCWNGLYRVNKKGFFNVPIGTKTQVIMKDDDFKSISKALKKVTLLDNDFEDIIKKAHRKDFVFVDPPYISSHNNNGFIKYNEKLFSWNDQIRLKDCLVMAKKRGAIILLTNAHNNSIKELYKSDFNLTEIKRAGILAANSRYRKEYKEYLIRS